LRVFIDDGASIVESFVRHPQPTTTASRSMDHDQWVDVTIVCDGTLWTVKCVSYLV